MTNLDSILKSRDITLPTNVHIVKSYGFSSSHVWIWELDNKKRLSNTAFELWCWRILLRDSWTARRSNQSILKEIILNIHWKDWCWSSNTLATWFKEPTHLKKKNPDAGKDWGQEEKGSTEDERAGWHHRLDGHEFGSTPGVGDGQGGPACCSSWGRK